MKYEVRYREIREGWFDVEAEDEIDAYNKFWDMVGTGEIDLLRTDMTESDVAGVYLMTGGKDDNAVQSVFVEDMGIVPVRA